MIPYPELVSALRDWRTRQGLPTTGSAASQIAAPVVEQVVVAPEATLHPIDPDELFDDHSVAVLPAIGDDDRPTMDLQAAAAEALDGGKAITELNTGETYIEDGEELIVESVELEPDAEQSGFGHDEETVITDSSDVGSDIFQEEPTKTSRPSGSIEIEIEDPEAD